MNLLRIDIKHDKWIPILLMALLSVHTFIDFFAMEMFTLSYVALVGMLLTIGLAAFLLIREHTITRFNLVVLFLLILIEGVSLMNANDWKNWTYISLSIVAFLILFYFYRDQYQALIIGVLIVLSFGVYAQLFQCITHPEKWLIRDDKHLTGYILGGNYNQIGSRILFAFTLAMLSIRYSKWWYLNLIPLMVSGLAILGMVQSMTSLSCIALFLILCVIRNMRLKKWGLIGLYVGWLLFQCVVCFSGTGLSNNELISWFVQDVLDKDMTFTGRTFMWDSALKVISDSPVWGYGFADREWYLSHMSTRAVGAHNLILNIMIYGGIIALGLYICIIAMSLRNLVLYSNQESLLLMASFGCLSIMMLFETYNIPVIILLLAFMYYYHPTKIE